MNWRICGLMAAGIAAAQSPGFEVLSLKPHVGPLTTMAGYSASGPRLTLEGYNLKLLLMEAHNLKPYQVVFASPPADEDMFYDVIAKAEGDAPRSRAEFRQMLQTAIGERFHLKLHREPKEMPVYALVIGKGGPKFRESAEGAKYSANFGVNGRNQNIRATKATMEMLAEGIGNAFWVDRPVVDRTGLRGEYDFKIEATPEGRRNGNPDEREVSVFTAVQEQLGLKLEASKAPVEVLVVDHAERPSGN
jgi:uncharacterized protein (TIGR03435 family)